MAALYRSLLNVRRILVFPEFKRSISLSPVSRLKEIIEKKEGKTLTIEAQIVPEPDKERYFKPTETKACPLCALGFPIKHTDVLILSQFMRPNGTVMPRRITGLCVTQQRRLDSLVAMALQAGLMPNLGPHGYKGRPELRPKWKKYNVYFDENTIRPKLRNVYEI